MNPSSTLTEESPIRPLAPPSKKLRSIHGNGRSNPPSNRTGSTGPVRDRFSMETEEAIAKRRAELRRLQEKRAGRVLANVPKANGYVATGSERAPPVATYHAVGGIPPTQPQFYAAPLPPQNYQITAPPTATTTAPEQHPPIPSPGQVARVRNSDIFPHVSKVYSERNDEPLSAPQLPNLTESSGGPEPRRLEAMFAKDEASPVELQEQHQNYQQPQQEEQHPQQQFHEQPRPYEDSLEQELQQQQLQQQPRQHEDLLEQKLQEQQLQQQQLQEHQLQQQQLEEHQSQQHQLHEHQLQQQQQLQQYQLQEHQLQQQQLQEQQLQQQQLQEQQLQQQQLQEQQLQQYHLHEQQLQQQQLQLQQQPFQHPLQQEEQPRSPQPVKSPVSSTSPKPVLSPSPEKPPLRSKSAPPSRPPLPPGPPPAREAPELRDGLGRSFAARPEPSFLTYEPITEAKTPSASQPPSPVPRSTSRQELLRSFHMYDDVNLIQVLAQQKKECGEAKRKIARLEDQVLKLTKERIVPRDLETFLIRVKEEGGEAALRWARERFPESFAQISLSDWPVALFDTIHATSPTSPRRILSFSALSPSASVSATSTTTTLKRLRAPTPHPKRQGYTQQQSPLPAVKDTEEYMYLAEAAKCVPVEYVSDVATIFVRCPYGASDHHEVDDPWKDGVAAAAAIVHENETDYVEQANVYKPETVQVIAKISADSSLLILGGNSTVRYKRLSSEAEASWKNLADDDTIATISSFGTVMFIDGDANEKEYSLDEIFEAAIATRETYCSSVISTAAGFMAMKVLEHNNNTPRFADHVAASEWSSPPIATPTTPAPVMVDQSVETDVPELVDECIGTEDLPPFDIPVPVIETKPPVDVSDACIGTEEPWPVPAAEPTISTPPKVPTVDACVGTEGEFKVEESSPALSPKLKSIPTEEKASHDLLSILLATIFSTIFWLIWTVLVRMPFQLVKYTTIVLLLWGLLTFAWFYLADDNGAEAMGALPLPFYNHYGIV